MQLPLLQITQVQQYKYCQLYYQSSRVDNRCAYYVNNLVADSMELQVDTAYQAKLPSILF